VSTIVLAYSGGLDTSVLLKRHILDGNRVIAMTLDLPGGPPTRRPHRRPARPIGDSSNLGGLAASLATVARLAMAPALAGATTTLVFYIYNNFANRTGVATAAATVFLLGVLMITAVQLLITRRQEANY